MESTAVNRGHIVTGPPKFFILRIFQIIFSVIVLGLSAYVINYFGEGILNAGPALSIFTSLVSLITVIYILVGQYGASSIYNYWAILGLEIFCIVFWIISFSLTADWAAAAFAYFNDGGCIELDDGYCYLEGAFQTGLDCAAAVAGIGALMFLLFIISVAIFGVFLHRHRRAGGHCTPGRLGGVAPQAYEPNSSVEPRLEMQPAQVQPQQQQGYSVAAPQFDNGTQQYATQQHQQYEQYQQPVQQYQQVQTPQPQQYQQYQPPVVQQQTGGSYQPSPATTQYEGQGVQYQHAQQLDNNVPVQHQQV